MVDPLRVLPSAQLLTWQLAGLPPASAGQDQHPNPPRAFAVLADPDVIGDADVVAGPEGRPDPALLVQRAAAAGRLRGNAGSRSGPGPPDSVHGLAAVVADALPGVDLAALEAREAQGIDIAADLDTAGLTRSGFLYLRAMAALAATGTLTVAEWADTIAVFTAAHKVA